MSSDIPNMTAMAVEMATTVRVADTSTEVETMVVVNQLRSVGGRVPAMVFACERQRRLCCVGWC